MPSDTLSSKASWYCTVWVYCSISSVPLWNCYRFRNVFSKLYKLLQVPNAIPPLLCTFNGTHLLQFLKALTLITQYSRMAQFTIKFYHRDSKSIYLNVFQHLRKWCSCFFVLFWGDFCLWNIILWQLRKYQFTTELKGR